jgi:hypothetical protein
MDSTVLETENIKKERSGQHIQVNIGEIGHLMLPEILSYDIPMNTIGY